MIFLINKSQKDVVKKLCKETKLSESQMVEIFIEIGLATFIASQHNSLEGNTEQLVAALERQIEKNDVMKRIAQRLTLWHKAGAEGDKVEEG